MRDGGKLNVQTEPITAIQKKKKKCGQNKHIRKPKNQKKVAKKKTKLKEKTLSIFFLLNYEVKIGTKWYRG